MSDKDTSTTTTTDIISKLGSDNVLAQRIHCGGCQRLIAQIEDPELVPIKGKARGATPDKEAEGILCKECRENEMYSKEGPRQAIYADANGDIRIDFIDNLQPLKAAAEGKEGE
jgi:hypothetical protein